MQIKLITGACGFVGRHLVKRLKDISDEHILMIDDLSTGKEPEKWLNTAFKSIGKNIKFYGNRIIFIQADVRQFFIHSEKYLQAVFHGEDIRFSDIYHLAAVVGGRMKIEKDPLAVAIDLSIDAEFFRWVVDQDVKRVLYPSSSAAYPVELQSKSNNKALAETDIDLGAISNPDLTYGWAKLTGEYLARIAAKNYDLHVCCIRPFSGYGGDQELEYPIPAIVKRFVDKKDPVDVWGDGSQSRDFIHIDDVIDGMIVALDKINDGSAVNLGTGKQTSFLELIKLLSVITQHDPKVKTLKDKPIGVYARYADMNWAKTRLMWSPKIGLEEGLNQVYRDISNLVE